MRASVPPSLWALLGLAACTSPATQLVVVVDTDFAVPDEIGYVRASVEGPGERRATPAGWEVVDGPPAADQVEMPFSFGVAPKDDEALAIVVTVEGFRSRGDAAPRIVSRARTGFIEGQSLELPIFLGERCRSVWMGCGPDETCSRGACEDAARPPETLEPHDPDQALGVPRPAVDAGAADARVRDAGTPDAGEDAGETDTGPPDAGEPDAGETDSGEPACDPPPAVIRVPLPFDPNVDLLAHDIDDDGITEIVAGFTGSGGPRGRPSEIAIVDFEGCYEPVVTSTPAADDLRQGVLFSDGALYAVTKDQISRWSYRGPNNLSRQVYMSERDIERLALTEDGREGLVVRRESRDRVYQRVDLATVPAEVVNAPEHPRSFSAHLAGARFVHADDRALRVVDPPANVVLELLAATQPRDPIVVARGLDRLVAARAEDTLRTVVWRNGAVAGSSTFTFDAPVLTGPVPLRSASAVRFVAVSERGLMSGCAQSGATCAALTATRTVDAMDVDEAPRLFTAQIDGDAHPDVIFVGRTGRIVFAKGDALDVDAHPPIDLAESTQHGSALALRFFESFGLVGAALIVQHPDALSIVRLDARGARDELWLQAGREAGRSAHLR